MSVWKTILEAPYPNREKVRGCLATLRTALGKGENHIIDAEHLVGGGMTNGGAWEWIDRGEDLDNADKVNSWLLRLGRLLRGHRRLRLYGDDHMRKLP